MNLNRTHLSFQYAFALTLLMVSLSLFSNIAAATDRKGYINQLSETDIINFLLNRDKSLEEARNAIEEREITSAIASGNLQVVPEDYDHSKRRQSHRIYTFPDASLLSNYIKKSWVDSAIEIVDPSKNQEASLTLFMDDSTDSTDWWYENKDESISKRLLDVNGQFIGIFSVMKDGTLFTEFDLNGDSRVDVMERIDKQGMRELLLSEIDGIEFMKEVVDGLNPFCGEVSSPIDPTDLIGAVVMPNCGGDNNSSAMSGNSNNHARQTNSHGDSVMDRLCANWQPNLSNPLDRVSYPGEGVVRGYLNIPKVFRVAGGAAGGVVRNFLWPKNAGDNGYNPDTGEWRPLVRDPETGKLRPENDQENRERFEREAKDREDSSSNTEGTDTDETDTDETDTEGTENSLPADPTNPNNGSLDQICSNWYDQKTRLSFWEDLNGKAVDTNCDDPVVNPNPTELGNKDNKTLHVNCFSGNQDQYTSNWREIIQTHRNRRQCSPNEIPESDGMCSGTNTPFNRDQTGQTVKLQGIDSLDFCPDVICATPEILKLESLPVFPTGVMW